MWFNATFHKKEKIARDILRVSQVKGFENRTIQKEQNRHKKEFSHWLWFCFHTNKNKAIHSVNILNNPVAMQCYVRLAYFGYSCFWRRNRMNTVAAPCIWTIFYSMRICFPFKQLVAWNWTAGYETMFYRLSPGKKMPYLISDYNTGFCVIFDYTHFTILLYFFSYFCIISYHSLFYCSQHCSNEMISFNGWNNSVWLWNVSAFQSFESFRVHANTWNWHEISLIDKCIQHFDANQSILFDAYISILHLSLGWREITGVQVIKWSNVNDNKNHEFFWIWCWISVIWQSLCN